MMVNGRGFVNYTIRVPVTKFIIIVTAVGLAPKPAGPSAGTIVMKKSDILPLNSCDLCHFRPPNDVIKMPNEVMRNLPVLRVLVNDVKLVLPPFFILLGQTVQANFDS